MSKPDTGIVFYHYAFSPYARRIAWYLALRGIDYAEVNQPPMMPRPDLEKIGVNYRRIPVMAIGKDVYCDTRLIIRKLEQLFPHGALGSTEPNQKAIQRLLEVWTVEAGLFVRASQLIPSDLPLMNNPKFVKDREQLSGRPWNKQQMEAQRPEALTYISKSFNFLETTLLADDREWILKTEKPSLADIEAIWVFDWLNGMKGALPPNLVSEKLYPKVYAWMTRFNDAVAHAKRKVPKPTVLKGVEAAQRIFDSTYAEDECEVDASDPSRLQKGALVQIWPTDSGFSHRDQGQLVSLKDDESVILLTNGIRLHFPRTNFRIKSLDSGGASKL